MNLVGRHDIPVIERFRLQVNKTNGCWLWTGHIGGHGKPVISHKCKQVYAHRFSYEMFVGPIPDGLYVCHHCDNPLCVRPDHLFVGTQDDNMKDMVSKGRANKPKGESNGRAVLTEDAVRFIRKHYKFRGGEYSQKGLAKRFGVGERAVQDILLGKKWTHVV